jgi:hypothetical protein
LIQGLQASGKVHETKGIHAMVEVVQVAQFMEGYLGSPFHLKVQGFLRGRGGRLETVDRDDGGPAPLPRFSKHMEEDGNEEIQIDNPDDLITLRERQGFHGGDNHAGIVLMPSFLVRIHWLIHGGKNERIEMEVPENVGGDGLDGQFTNLSQGDDTDGFIA